MSQLMHIHFYVLIIIQLILCCAYISKNFKNLTHPV